jgi:pectate lyase
MNKLLRVPLIAFLLASTATLTFAQDFPVGWASVNELGFNGTTGGAGGTEVTVTTFEELVDYANRGGPYIIYISGTITQPGGDPVRIEEHNGQNGNNAGNKTILGLGDNAVFQGEIRIRKGARNIIIRNIKFDGRNSTGDGVSIEGQSVSGSGPVHHIWVDRCDFTGYTDGATDISHAADFVTVSWNHYYGNARTSLLGHSDTNAAEDAGHLTVTYHHNWLDHEIQRMPRVRFSRLAHIFNNFYDLDGSAIYATVSTEGASLLLENNYFKNVGTPFKSASGHDSSGPGFLVERGSVFENCGDTREQNNPGGNTVPEASTFYSYTLDAAAGIPALVVAGAGVGKISTVEDTTPPTPDPMTWAVEPAATGESTIAMTATTADDLSGVEYYFANVTDGAHDSGWQLSPEFTDSGLTPATEYAYTVTARDRNIAHNATQPSVQRSATTDAPDTAPPTPDPATWAVEPLATGLTTIEMTATAGGDAAGVEYYFANLTDAAHDSGWQDAATYIDTGLAPSTLYSYRVTVRDKSAARNETAPSDTRSATTDAIPPLPDPVAHWKFDESAGTVAPDDGPNGLHGTLVATSDASWIVGRFGNALDFDGVDDQVSIPHNAAIDFAAGPFTIAFWLRQSALGANQQVYLVKGGYATADAGQGKRYEIYAKDTTFRFAIDDDATKSEITSPIANFITGDWVFVVAVRDTAADRIRLYADGTQRSDGPDNSGNIAENDMLRLGRQPYITAATQPLDATLDDLRIYNVALTPEQILGLFAGAGGDGEAASPSERWLSS